MQRGAAEHGVQPISFWTVEHCYPIFSRRFGALQLIPVFAAEVSGTTQPAMTWEHSEYGWFTAAEVPHPSFRLA